MATQTQRNANSRQDGFTLSPDDWQEYAARGTEQVRDLVRDNAGRSVLIALGAGLGVGLLIGSALAGGRRSSRNWDRSTAENFGQSWLNKLEGLVPNSVSERFHD